MNDKQKHQLATYIVALMRADMNRPSLPDMQSVLKIANKQAVRDYTESGAQSGKGCVKPVANAAGGRL